MIKQFKNLYYKTRNQFFTSQYNNRQRYFQRQFQKIAENNNCESKIINKVGFYFYGENHLAHLSPIIRHLPKGSVELVTPEIECQPEYLTKTGIKVRNSMDVLASANKYRCLVSLFMMPPNWWQNILTARQIENEELENDYFDRLAVNNVRMVYSLGALPWNTSEVMRAYDSIFVYGPHEERIYREKFGKNLVIKQVGYPKFDCYFNDQLPNVKCENDLLPNRKTLLWLPTKGKLSSIEKYIDIMSELCTEYNVVLKPHPQEDPEILKKVNSTSVILSKSPDSAPYYKLADYVFCDYGGSAFGALYTDKPIIFLSPDNPEQDSKNYSNVSPEVKLRKYFVTLGLTDSKTIKKILQDKELWEKDSSVRHRKRTEFFTDNYGECGKTAAQILINIING